MLRKKRKTHLQPVRTLRLATACILFAGTLYPASALEERWHADIDVAARGLPATLDIDNDGNKELVFSSRFDGAFWVFDSAGAQRSKLTRPRWLDTGVALTTHGPLLDPLAIVQDSAGEVVVVNLASNEVRTTALPGKPCLGTSATVINIDNVLADEIVVARENGNVFALDRQASILWQYDAGAAIQSTPTCAPVFTDGAAVYVADSDGVIHCIHGSGRPVWTFAMQHAAPRFPSTTDLLVMPSESGSPVVIVSDSEGWLYALDAASGTLIWSTQAAATALGAPAVIDIHASPGRELICVSEHGEVSIVGSDGTVLERHALDAGSYVPRPLVADVDGDGAYDMLVATRDWRILVTTLQAKPTLEIKLRGSAREGLVLSDIDGDGFHELLAVTDCARGYCFSTRAREGWLHPRGGNSQTGCVDPISEKAVLDEWTGSSRLPRAVTVTMPIYSRDQTSATLTISFPSNYARRRADAVVRDDNRVLGSASQILTDSVLRIGYQRASPAPLTLDLIVRNPNGRDQRRSVNVSIAPLAGIPVPLPPRDEFIQAVLKSTKERDVPESWELPRVAGRDFWNVITDDPEAWRKFGLARKPFIREAALRIPAPATSDQTLFKPGHPAWERIAASDKPFFVQNEYFRPTVEYPPNVYGEIVQMAGSRFLGFQVHEWAYRVWKDQLEGAKQPPDTVEEATKVMRRDFEIIRGRSQGRIYAGEGYCLISHQAYSWGAPIAYAEIGENMPCVPLQLAWLRGAARQWNGKPWGAYISNWFRGSVLDTQYVIDAEPVRWHPPEDASGPHCGHSPSLEYRLALASRLAGATFVHHESDLFHGSVFVEEKRPNEFALSDHGKAFESAYDLAKANPDRGVPYTPIAFLVDFDHGWRPNQPVYGIWPQGPGAKSMEAVFRHVFAWSGGLDFESGYLTNGPYGDVFDVLTAGRNIERLNDYAVVWPVGRIRLTAFDRRALSQFVNDGGVLVVDHTVAAQLPPSLTGVTFVDDIRYATGVQTALGAISPVTVPMRFSPLRLSREANTVAWTESGEPLVAWTPVGEGMVVVSGTHDWLDEADALAPVVPVLMRTVCDTVLPVAWTGDVQTLINKTKAGWLVTLINNKGVAKVPTLPAVVNEDEAQTCLLTARAQAPKRFHAQVGNFTWDLAAKGLWTTIPPGEAAIVEIISDPK